MKNSLLIPTRNAEWCLPYCLKFINQLNPPPDEILICIGNSRDRTEEIAINFQKESKVSVKIFYEREGLGTGKAINILVTNAKNELCLWVDSDTILPSNWIEATNYLFEIHNISVLGCAPFEINSKDISTIKIPDIDLNNIWYRDGIEQSGGMTAFKKSVILNLGNFDPFFARGQDWDMTIRCVSKKIRGGIYRAHYHAGLVGKMNFKKIFTRQTFWKFFYKYGWRYCIIDLHHTIAAGLRHFFLLSLLVFLITLNPYVLVLNLVIVLGLVVGIFITYKKFSFNLLLLQLGGSLGEICQLYSVLTMKNKPKFGYGAEWLK